MRVIEFISYDGKYPNLCSGTLTIRVGDAIHDVKYCMESGGKCFIDFDGEEVVKRGDWKISAERFKSFLSNDEIKEVERLVNINVPCGCCGGCL